MLPIEFNNFVRKKPFRPFRMTLSNGWSYEVTHPEMAVVGFGSVMVGVSPKPPRKADDDSDVLVSLLHVLQLEYLDPL